MARKGNQQRNGLHHGGSNLTDTKSETAGKPLSDESDTFKSCEGKVPDSNTVPICEVHGQLNNPLEDGTTSTKFSARRKKSNKRSGKGSNRQRSEDSRMPNLEESVPSSSKTKDGADFGSIFDGAETREYGGVPQDSNINYESPRNNMRDNSTGENVSASSKSSDTMPSGGLTTLTTYVLGVVKEWLWKQKPWVTSLSMQTYDLWNKALIKIEHGYPIVLTWILQRRKRLDSLLRLGTTSLFTVIWCSVLSTIAMIGFSKMFTIMVITGLVFVFIGLPFAILVLGIFATIILWIYGSFWTTGFVIFVGGISFATNHERVSLFIATGYAVYSAKGYIGWPGLILGFNLAFFSGDGLIYLLKNKIDDQRSNRPEQAWQSHGRTDHHSNGETWQDPFVDDASVRHTDRSPGVPSTSGAETDLTSEEEIMRLLNCNDHYSALGLARYETIDASYLKREYRKKAMLVHPDKNMGNEKAAEAFKKLQNAYEVLLDSLKRKTYDDELRREELLNYIRRLQTTSQKSGKHGIFTTSGSVHPRPEEEAASLGDSRRITCKKCGDFHLWAQASRSKSRARWCQECKDLHPAKDGDGWVEQSFQPLLFGLLNKMSPPIAYVCADSRIYDATEWFLCQGMSCPVNTHKPSFHVNTSVASRHGTARPGPTEVRWPLPCQAGTSSGSGSASGSKSNLKKRKKGKKQW
ncbi:unnamed protein product [Spirodela intermedia]|uniref:J domain-containing protein n=1 Tax=Spirodela intermedia TaxID=51605 RepID=A0A7I8JHK2_SPIIN|nr:unnamed protein product [Spirodela intermedia]CAA6668902.1 unnamed protein product [Spirodela intermedia]